MVNEEVKCLEFAKPSIELDVEPGVTVEDCIVIDATDIYAQGRICSSDTRVKLYSREFGGDHSEIMYCFDGTNTEPDTAVNGFFTVISNYGEYTIPFLINVKKPKLMCSIGEVKNLFHFANLAQTDWSEAVELFYSPHFANIFHKNDHDAYIAYLGLSKSVGNERNLEEFLIEVNKKNPITYTFNVEGFILEDVQDSVTKSIVINKSCWGYSSLNIEVVGDFVSVDRDMLTNEDFSYNACDLNVYIDASKLHNGINSASIIFSDTCISYTIPVDILMDDEPERRTDNRKQKQALCNIVKSYLDYRYARLNKSQWCDSLDKEVKALLELDEDSILYNLYRARLLILKDRQNEAKWQLDVLEQRLKDSRETDTVFLSALYLYLTTLINTEPDYVRAVVGELEQAYAKWSDQWEIGWFLFLADDELRADKDRQWAHFETMFERGCTSPMMLCEALLFLQENPTYLKKLDSFETCVLWHGAKHKVLSLPVVEQLQYLVARKNTYSPLLFRTLCEVYETYKSPQTVASICHMLILGEKRGVQYYQWYNAGVECSVRVPGLYEYYMMSLEIDKYGDIVDSIEIPKTVLMYFAYQSNLDDDLNAFLYAYIIKNKDKYPDLEQSYRIASERFIVDMIKAGRISENLAYLYKNMLTANMITEETAYAYTPLLFMHRIYVDNPEIKNIVVVQEKINGESSYPVGNNVCMIPIYGSEYKLFLQDEEGNRFTKSIYYENKQLMEPRQQLDFVSSYMQGRLSFDIYLCELDRKYITISQNNVKRYKNLVDSPQVVSTFKQEIRTKLLKFYYDNDMIGELDAFLEDIEPDSMNCQERAEFIKYLVSRGMFEKAYYWVKAYGVAGIEHKTVARLISKRIVSRNYEYDEFLVDVSYYIYKNTKYDESILRYLMLNYDGTSSELRRLWRSAADLELDAKLIMERILRQTQYTGTKFPERNSILIEYAGFDQYDERLVDDILLDEAYEYFVNQSVAYNEVFSLLYDKYKAGRINDKVCRLALLKYWAENRDSDIEIPYDDARKFVQLFVKSGIYFPFYTKLADFIPELHYVKNGRFVEYRTKPQSRVYMHYIFEDEPELRDSDLGDDMSEVGNSYEMYQMQEMYDGIYVAMFQLFHGESVQYYISESYYDSDNKFIEYTTQSDTIYGQTGEADGGEPDDRFTLLNEIILSKNLKDEATAQQLTQEYLCRDFCVRELFKII